jgi:SAM-dependent methyltransferase
MNKKESYTESHKKKEIGKNYDKCMYSKDTWSNRIWQIEKYILSKILLGKENSKVMDFATGTGRIPEFLEKIGFQNITGIDSSKSMLKPARKKLKKTDLLCLDITNEKDYSKIKGKKFDIILSFRFFLNIENRLKDIIMKRLNGIIEDDGIFIFNIHSNKYSFIGIKEFLNRSNGKKGNLLSVKEVKSLADRNGFLVKEIYSYGFIPHKRKFSFLNYKAWYFLEKLLISKRNLMGGI